MKNILICCGTSMITSSVVVNKVKTALQKEKIDARFHQCKYSDVPVMVKNLKPDLIIPTGNLSNAATGDVPVVMGTPFLTGVGIDDTLRKIIDVLKK